MNSTLTPRAQLPLHTGRLRLRELTEDDAAFVVTLLNDAAFLRFVGDRGVRNVNDAINYLQNGPMSSYRDNGFGLYAVEQLSDNAAIGMCGLVRREWLDAADLGFALLPAYRGRGYALEAAQATLEFAFGSLQLKRILAIASPENQASITLLNRVGMRLIGQCRPPKEVIDLSLFEQKR